MLRFDYYSRNPHEEELNQYHARNFYNGFSSMHDKSKQFEKKNRKIVCDDSHRQREIQAMRQELNQLEKLLDGWVEKVNSKKILKKPVKDSESVEEHVVENIGEKEIVTSDTPQMVGVEEKIEENEKIDSNVNKGLEIETEQEIDAPVLPLEDNSKIEYSSQEESLVDQLELTIQVNEVEMEEQQPLVPTYKKIDFYTNDLNSSLPSVEDLMLQECQKIPDEMSPQEDILPLFVVKDVAIESKVWMQMHKKKIRQQRRSKLHPRGDGPFQMLAKTDEHAWILQSSAKIRGRIFSKEGGNDVNTSRAINNKKNQLCFNLSKLLQSPNEDRKPRDEVRKEGQQGMKFGRKASKLGPALEVGRPKAAGL